MHKDCSVKLTAEFAGDMKESRRQKNTIYEELKEICQPKIL